MSDWSPYNDRAPFEAESDTSEEAADSMRPHLGRLQAVVLREIRRGGLEGATDDEIEQRTGLKHQTVSARRRELYLKGLIEKDTNVNFTPMKRRTRSGRSAQIWVVCGLRDAL